MSVSTCPIRCLWPALARHRASSRAPALSSAANRISTMVAVNCSHKMRQGVRPPCSTNSFGPTRRSQAVASAALNPCVTSVLISRATCSAGSRCHCALVSSSFPKADKQKGEAIASGSMVSPSELNSARPPGHAARHDDCLPRSIDISSTEPKMRIQLLSAIVEDWRHGAVALFLFGLKRTLVKCLTQ